MTDGSLRNLEVKVGDTVLFGKYSGTPVKVEGKEVLVMKEEEILGVLH
jgi:chaperonin GroES